MSERVREGINRAILKHDSDEPKDAAALKALVMKDWAGLSEAQADALVAVWQKRPRLDAKRLATTYPFRSLLDAGAPVAFGSDWPVAPLDPIAAIYAAVTRRTLDDRNPGGWVPEQKVTVEEALRAHTSGSAYAAFEEAVKGRLAPGFVADFVTLSDDLFTIAPERIRDVKVLRTVVGGREIHSR